MKFLFFSNSPEIEIGIWEENMTLDHVRRLAEVAEKYGKGDLSDFYHFLGR